MLRAEASSYAAGDGTTVFVVARTRLQVMVDCLKVASSHPQWTALEAELDYAFSSLFVLLVQPKVEKGVPCTVAHAQPVAHCEHLEECGKNERLNSAGLSLENGNRIVQS